jgi:hypothetical protein
LPGESSSLSHTIEEHQQLRHQNYMGASSALSVSQDNNQRESLVKSDRALHSPQIKIRKDAIKPRDQV